MGTGTGIHTVVFSLGIGSAIKNKNNDIKEKILNHFNIFKIF